MAAKAYYSPFIPAFSSNGAPVPGAKLNFYNTGTTTRLAIYTTDALTTEHANPVVADAAGKFPAIYLNDANVYRVVMTDADGTQIGDTMDPYIPGTALKFDAEDLDLLTQTVVDAEAAQSAAELAETNAATSASEAASVTERARRAATALDNEFNEPSGWDHGISAALRFIQHEGVALVMMQKGATWSDTYAHSTGYEFIDTATGARWAAVDVAALHKPTTSTTIYVDWATGNDANPGSSGSPKKTLDAALSAGNDIRIKSRIVGTSSFTSQRAFADHASIKGEHSSGKKTWISGIRDGEAFTFTDLGDGVFKSVTSVSNTAKNGASLLYVGSDDPVSYEWVSGTYADDTARKAALLAVAGPAWLVDESAEPDAWYIKTETATAPSFGAAGDHVYSEGGFNFFEVAAAKTLYLENLAFHYNGKTADQAAVLLRTDNVVAATSGTGAEWDGRAWLRDCGVYGGGKQGLKIEDLALYGGSGLKSCYHHSDALNAHSNNSEGTTLGGSYMRGFWQDVTAFAVGDVNYRDQSALTGSDQSYANHDRIIETVVNMVGRDTYGACAAVVSGSKTWMVGCHFDNPQGPDAGPTDANPTADGSPCVAYWVDGADSELWLSGCSGSGPNETFCVSNGATLYIDKWIGPDWSVRLVNGGMVKDFNGNDLSQDISVSLELAQEAAAEATAAMDAALPAFNRLKERTPADYGGSTGYTTLAAAQAGSDDTAAIAALLADWTADPTIVPDFGGRYWQTSATVRFEQDQLNTAAYAIGGLLVAKTGTTGTNLVEVSCRYGSIMGKLGAFGTGGTTYSGRGWTNGIFIDDSSRVRIEAWVAENFKRDGMAIYEPSTENNIALMIGPGRANNCGSALGQASTLLTDTFTTSDGVRTGSSGSIAQRQPLTMATAVPAEIAIDDTVFFGDEPYVVTAISGSTLTVYPWLPNGTTAGTLTYGHGAGLRVEGANTASSSYGLVEGFRCGSVISAGGLYAGRFEGVQSQVSGCALRIGNPISSACRGLQLDYFHAESTKFDIIGTSTSPYQAKFPHPSAMATQATDEDVFGQSRQISPRLTAGGYSTTYSTFKGTEFHDQYGPIVGDDNGVTEGVSTSTLILSNKPHNRFKAQKRTTTTIELKWWDATDATVFNHNWCRAVLYGSGTGNGPGGTTTVSLDSTDSAAGVTVNGGASVSIPASIYPIEVFCLMDNPSTKNWLVTWREIRPSISATGSFNPPSIAAGATTTTTLTVTGAALGDMVTYSFSLSLAGLIMTAYVSATDTVTFVFYNPTAGAIDLGNGTLRATVHKA